MVYFFVFIALLFINYLVYSSFAFPGLFILNVSVVVVLLIMIYDKLNSAFNKSKHVEKTDENELKRLIKEYETSKSHFQEKDLPNENEINKERQ